MDVKELTEKMAFHAVSIRQLVSGVSDAQALWKPDPDSWSILEVINHLYDEERFDFRVRLDIILHHADQPWPEINPEGWVTERRYNQRDLGDTLRDFLREREVSLTWLRELAKPNWTLAYETPWGSMTAGDMFAAWVAHDLLHMRQLIELHWAFTTQRLEPYQVVYAGRW